MADLRANGDLADRLSSKSNLNPTNICVSCHGITVETLSQESDYRLHPSVAVWIQSARSCACCNLLLRAFVKSQRDSCSNLLSHPAKPGQSHPLLHLNDPYMICISVNAHSEQFNDSYWTSCDGKDHRKKTNYDTRFPVCFAGDRSSDGPRVFITTLAWGTCHLFTDEGDPATQYNLKWHRNLPPDSCSPTSFQVAKRWLSDCLSDQHPPLQFPCYQQSHPPPRRCPDPDTSILPTRLIELIAGGHPCSARLVTGCAKGTLYTTLSYTWGRDTATWKTVKSNVDERMLHFDTKILPQTIRDALRVTAGLGLQHMWIDSLCIVQDNAEDWTHEVTRMGDIYSGCHVMISATSCSSSSDALFNTTSKSHAESMDVVRLTGVLSKGQVSTLYLHERAKHSSEDLWEYEVERGPLAKRGWACQENILSPRTLYYTSAQLMWQCNHCVLTQDNLNGDHSEKLRSRDLFFDVEPAYRRIESPEQTNAGQTSDGFLSLSFVHAWYINFVQNDYSRRKCTYSEDKLVAIAGLVEAVHRNFPQRYLAGLWEDSILEGLSWVRHGPGNKSAMYLAPSWSWAPQLSRVAFLTRRWGSDQHNHCRLVEATVDNDPRMPFGRVFGGSVVLEAHVLTITDLELRQRSDTDDTFTCFNGVSAKIVPDDADYFAAFGRSDDCSLATPEIEPQNVALDATLSARVQDTLAYNTASAKNVCTEYFQQSDLHAILLSSNTGRAWFMLLRRLSGKDASSFQRIGMATMEKCRRDNPDFDSAIRTATAFPRQTMIIV